MRLPSGLLRFGISTNPWPKLWIHRNSKVIVLPAGQPHLSCLDILVCALHFTYAKFKVSTQDFFSAVRFTRFTTYMSLYTITYAVHLHAGSGRRFFCPFCTRLVSTRTHKSTWHAKKGCGPWHVLGFLAHSRSKMLGPWSMCILDMHVISDIRVWTCTALRLLFQALLQPNACSVHDLSFELLVAPKFYQFELPVWASLLLSQKELLLKLYRCCCSSSLWLLSMYCTFQLSLWKREAKNYQTQIKSPKANSRNRSGWPNMATMPKKRPSLKSNQVVKVDIPNN